MESFNLYVENVNNFKKIVGWFFVYFDKSEVREMSMVDMSSEETVNLVAFDELMVIR